MKFLGVRFTLFTKTLKFSLRSGNAFLEFIFLKIIAVRAFDFFSGIPMDFKQKIRYASRLETASVWYGIGDKFGAFTVIRAVSVRKIKPYML